MLQCAKGRRAKVPVIFERQTMICLGITFFPFKQEVQTDQSFKKEMRTCRQNQGTVGKSRELKRLGRGKSTKNNDGSIIKYSKSMQNSRDGGQFKKLKWVLQQKKANHPNKRWGHSSVVYEGKLLIFGGSHSGVTREGLHRLDCQTLDNKLIDYAVQPETRESHSTILYQDSLLIYGGCINQEVRFFLQTLPLQLTNDLLMLKVIGQPPTWRKLQQKNPISPRESHVCVLVEGKYMLVYGGITPQETFLEQYWLLDIENALWLPIEDIQGKIQARIGITMTSIGHNIYAFGGEYGEGEESQYSNDLLKLNFQGQIRMNAVPTLNIAKIEASGVRPNPRTGHASVDYKGKLLIIMGGEGVSSRRASILYNDVWAFDLRTLAWSQLQIQNRTLFRPRANFTANLYKNTIYVFGGFVNLNTFKCTDELLTLTLNETRYAQRMDMEHRSSMMEKKIEGNGYGGLSFCAQCRFEFIQQNRNTSGIVSSDRSLKSSCSEAVIPLTNGISSPGTVSSLNYLQSSPQNILYASKFIQTPFQALGLVCDGISKMKSCGPSNSKKTLQINLTHLKSAEGDLLMTPLLERAHLSINIGGLFFSKEELKNIILSYSCNLEDDPYFDLKNGLFRLGSEILICQLFQDGMLHCYFMTAHGIIHNVIHLQTLIFQLKRKENQILKHYLEQYAIELEKDTEVAVLRVFVGGLRKGKNQEFQLHKNEETNELIFGEEDKQMTFKEFMKDYFLGERKIKVKVFNAVIPTPPFEKTLRSAGTQRQQQPSTDFFSRTHLLITPTGSKGTQGRVYLYALSRRVGSFAKYPQVRGYIQLSDLSSLNFPRTRCESFEIRKALEEEIKILYEEYRKRDNEIPVKQLEDQVEKDRQKENEIDLCKQSMEEERLE